MCLEYLLTHNFFMFDGDFYLQKCGASMGAKFSPSLANLYMGWWERSRIFGPESPHLKDTAFYCRYIDDLLFIVSEPHICLDQWLEYMNDNALNLKFTGQHEPKSIEFLDVKLTGDNNEIISNLYRKPTAGNTLLRADSSHPTHTIKSIPVGQFLRLKRLCTRQIDFEQEAIHMSARFEARGYPRSAINRALSIANKTPRANLLMDKPSNHSRRNRSEKSHFVPTFSTPYSAEFHKIKKIVTKYLPVLSNDHIYSQILNKGIRTVSRKAPSLGGLLSPSLYISKKQTAHWLQFKGTYRCGGRSCTYCPFIKGGDTVTSTSTGKSYKIQSFINCNTRYIVYVITCTICSIQYVGRTTRRLRDRLYDHLYDIEKEHATNIARHWVDIHFKDTSSLTIQGIEKIVKPPRGGDKFGILCKQEVRWIFNLNTRRPTGLNFEWDVSHFYQ